MLEPDCDPLVVCAELHSQLELDYSVQGEAEWSSGATRLTIADIAIDILSADGQWFFPPNSAYPLFATHEVPEAGGTRLQVHWDAAPRLDLGEEVFVARFPDSEEPAVRLYRRDATRIALVGFSASGPRSHKTAVLDAGLTCGDVYVELLEDTPDGLPYPLAFPLDRILLSNILALGRGIMVHACGAEFDGRGVLFVGPSGAGKTTMARLLRDQSDVRVLSDETVVVSRVGDQYRLYGTPWAGSDRLADPGGTPLVGIFFIRHSASNTVSPRPTTKAVEALLAQTYSAFYEGSAMQHTLDFCSDLGLSGPIYDLGFVPTPEIARQLRHMVLDL